MPAVSISRFTDEMLAFYAPPRRAAATRRQVAQVLREFAEAGVKKTTDFRTAAVCRWMDRHPNRTAVTHRSSLRCLKAICQRAVDEGWLKINPVRRGIDDYIRADRGPKPKPRPGHRPLDDIARVLAQADADIVGGDWQAHRLRALVYVYAYLGLRAAEALHLWREDVDLVRQVVTLQAHPEDGWTPKTLGSAAVLPLAAPLVSVLEAWLPMAECRWLFPGLRRRGPWLHGGPGIRPLDQVADLGRRAGVERLTIAAFRKTIGTYAKTWGLGQLELKALLRHTEAETQRWYDDEAVDALRPAAAKVTFPRLAQPA